MSLFVFAVLAGLLLYQLVSLIQPSGPDRQLSVGDRVRITLPEHTYLLWKSISIATAVILFFFLVTILIAQKYHPTTGHAYRFADAVTSPKMAAAVFGGLVGMLIGNFLNRILWNGSNYTFKAFDFLEVGLIFFLIILGIGGEEWLRSAAQRINKVSVGTTTEVSFSERQPRNSRTAAEQPS